MEIREDQTKTITQSVLVKTLCDKCKCEIVRKRFDASDFDFTYKTGNLYPEGGSGNIFEMDLCDPCVQDLMVLLKTNGYVISEREWDC